MSGHMQREIDSLKQKILSVGALAEEALANSVVALANRNRLLAKAVTAADGEIDRMEVEVEEDCLKILALYQPVAVDLRFVVSILKMNNDLERMGDLASNIAERADFLAAEEKFALPPELFEMGARAQTMLRQSLEALVNSDVALARQVCRDDDVLDRLQRVVIDWVFAEIRKTPERAEALVSVFSASRHLERLGDTATNVAEDVIYMVEGQIIRHQSIDAVG